MHSATDRSETYLRYASKPGASVGNFVVVSILAFTFLERNEAGNIVT